MCKHRNILKKQNKLKTKQNKAKTRKRELGSVLGWIGRQLAPFFDMEMRPKLVIENTIWTFHNMHEKNPYPIKPFAQTWMRFWKEVDRKTKLTLSFPSPVCIVHWLAFPHRLIPTWRRRKRRKRCLLLMDVLLGSLGYAFLSHRLWGSAVQHKPVLWLFTAGSGKPVQCLLHFSSSLLQRGRSLLVRHWWL